MHRDGSELDRPHPPPGLRLAADYLLVLCANLVLSVMIKRLDSKWIQPRWVKSASALFTVSLEAPSSWAISAWVSPCSTRRQSPSCAEPLGKVEQLFGHAPGNVSKYHVGDGAVSAAQAAGQNAQRLFGNLRPVGDPGT